MTPSLRERVRNLPRIVEVVEPVCVAVWEEPEPAPAADMLPELEFAHR
jgi:hypothetical protein